MDPISHEISHIVVASNGFGERQVPADVMQNVEEGKVTLSVNAEELQQYEEFKRDEFVTIHDVEIAHLEDNLHVEAGEVLVPLPPLERDVKRRTFFTNLTHAIGVLLGLPFVFPVAKFLMKPMYAPFDNQWLEIGSTSKIKKDDIGYQYKYKKKVKEAFMPEAEIEKNVWVLKATPDVLNTVYGGQDMKFYDSKGKVVWTNKKNFPYVAFSGKCPHLGCGYKWRRHKILGEVFLCPCHLSIYDAGGKVLDGPAPRGLDPVPIRLTAGGKLEIVDVEYKAGTKGKTRII